jgi:hypothetical protein
MRREYFLRSAAAMRRPHLHRHPIFDRMCIEDQAAWPSQDLGIDFHGFAAVNIPNSCTPQYLDGRTVIALDYIYSRYGKHRLMKRAYAVPPLSADFGASQEFVYGEHPDPLIFLQPQKILVVGDDGFGSGMDGGFYDFIIVFISRHYMEFDLRRASYCTARDVFLRFSQTPGEKLELHLHNFQYLIHDGVRNEPANFAGEGHLQQLLRLSTPQQCADV